MNWNITKILLAILFFLEKCCCLFPRIIFLICLFVNKILYHIIFLLFLWQVIEAGANAIVAGSAVFGAPDYAAGMKLCSFLFSIELFWGYYFSLSSLIRCTEVPKLQLLMLITCLFSDAMMIKFYILSFCVYCTFSQREGKLYMK